MCQEDEEDPQLVVLELMGNLVALGHPAPHITIRHEKETRVSGQEPGELHQRPS